MPSFLVVYEDTSPFFTYSGTWVAGSSRDNAADSYSESSFMVTRVRGSSFSFSFYGTEFGIYGAKRFNHGLYQGNLDGVTAPQVSGLSSDALFNATLYSATTGKGWHNVTLVNMEDNYLDVDWVSWKASVGGDNEPLIVNTWQDAHPAFAYLPANAWTASPPSVGSFSGGTGHGTSTQGASLSITFKGDAIALYGPAGPDSAYSYSVQIDNQPLARYSALKSFYRARQLLYYGANLGSGSHNMVVKLEATSNVSQMLAIDYAEIYTTPSLEGSKSSSLGMILGIAICGFVSVLSLGLLVFIWSLYKKGRFNFAPTKSQPIPAPGPQSQHAHSQQSSYFPYLPPTMEYSPLTLTAQNFTPSGNARPPTSPEPMSLAASSGTNSSLGASRPGIRFSSVRKHRPSQPTSQDVQGGVGESSGPVVVPPPSYIA